LRRCLIRFGFLFFGFLDGFDFRRSRKKFTLDLLILLDVGWRLFGSFCVGCFQPFQKGGLSGAVDLRPGCDFTFPGEFSQFCNGFSGKFRHRRLIDKNGFKK